MERHDKLGWIAAILAFAIGMGLFFSSDFLYYKEVEAVPAVYELIPLTATQTFGNLLVAVGLCLMLALLMGVLLRLWDC